MKTVLVVDPDEKSRRDVMEALPREGIETIELRDGVEVLHCLKERTVDLIISEVELPFLGGLDLAKAIKGKADHSRTAIVFLTVKADPMSMIEGIKAGAKQYLTKPVQTGELGEKLRKILGAR